MKLQTSSPQHLSYEVDAKGVFCEPEGNVILMKKRGWIRMNIGLIGCGTIGQFLLEQLNEKQRVPGARVTAIFDEREKSIGKLKHLSEQYNLHYETNLQAFLASSIDLVIECANIEAVRLYGEQIVQKKDVLLISIGALVDAKLYGNLARSAAENGHIIHLPAGAIGGLDLIQAAAILGELTEVTLTTRKPAYALISESVTAPKTIFSGNAKKAIAQFPKNANVAITLSYAGLGIEQTKVSIIADPTITKNIHHIQAKGAFGETSIEIQNDPSPENPKTSYLTSLSILKTIQQLTTTVKIS